MSFRLGRATAAALVALLTLTNLTVSPPGPATAQSLEDQLADARGRADRLEDDLAGAERRLEEARRDVAQLQDQLRVAGRELEQAQAEQAEAAASAELARRRAERAVAQLTAAEGELDANQDSLAAFASETYKYGAATASPTLLTLRSLSTAGGATDLADSLQAMRLGIREQRRVVEEAHVLRTRTQVLADAAAEEQRAEQRFLDAASDAADRAAEAHARVQQLVADASAAEARRRDRVAELEQARRAVDGEIADLETEIRLERERREREAAERAAREREAAERAAREREAAERAAAQRSTPQPARQRSTAPASGGTSVSAGPASGLVTVGGITVAASLGPSLRGLLDHARADGIVLGGHGYRSPEAQAQLRIANGCPDVWTAPASSCRVPTAIPGTSEHEKGLAVDFTWQGRTICFPRSAASCRGNAAFDWLRANAGTYGLRNLPSEAWHWSTTGR